jgi:hypothetical protein
LRLPLSAYLDVTPPRTDMTTFDDCERAFENMAARKAVGKLVVTMD